MPPARGAKLLLAIVSLALRGRCRLRPHARRRRGSHAPHGVERVPPEPRRRAQVSAGTLTIVVHNYGRLTHNLVVSANGQTTARPSRSRPARPPSWTLDLAPGKYPMASTILSDQALGAYGTLTSGLIRARRAGARAPAPNCAQPRRRPETFAFYYQRAIVLLRRQPRGRRRGHSALHERPARRAAPRRTL